MAECPVRYFTIEKNLQTEIKETLEHKNQSYVDGWYLSDKEIIITRLNLPLHMIWDGRRYHLLGHMTHLVGMPS